MLTLETWYFSTENNSSPEANNHFKPSPRPRSMLKKHSHGEEKDGPGEGKTPALCEELEARSAPSPLPKLNDGQLEAEKKLASENLDPKVSTTAELCSRPEVFASDYEKEIVCTRVCVFVGLCVFTCFLQQLIGNNLKTYFFNVQYSIESKTSPTVGYSKNVALFLCTAEKEENSAT